MQGDLELERRLDPLIILNETYKKEKGVPNSEYKKIQVLISTQ